ncbi:RNA dependent RNA polymerase [Leishmania RNA virus 1 - 1]|uniref:Probable RNA-directed RNA polymerase n=1 Tax=Leishmania RNA virus 1 - 1 (isolate Leishmania guyanensis) TaxID=58103 RepID=RDRP_LRVLG|nr:RNA dependent RNA polymerase [Leishmania RNA virus 1 - 1]Q02382.1 RecName: Full=Probable RNA-directed RNA polymerase [Leishmania RNA virus 1 - 1]AAB50024.1 RNA dependent RNA polymerase [Leishmania RNA virus 1 - 1]
MQCPNQNHMLVNRAMVVAALDSFEDARRIISGVLDLSRLTNTSVKGQHTNDTNYFSRYSNFFSQMPAIILNQLKCCIKAQVDDAVKMVLQKAKKVEVSKPVEKMLTFTTLNTYLGYPESTGCVMEYTEEQSGPIAAKLLITLLSSTLNAMVRPKSDPNISQNKIPRHYYQLKVHVGAQKKVNLTAIEVIRGCQHECSVVYCEFVRYSAYFAGLYDDQVAAILLYAVAAHNVQGFGARFCVLWALMCVRIAGFADDINIYIKHRGMSGLLPQLVEMKCLLGRGVNEIDVETEARRRLDVGSLSMQRLDENELRAAVRLIYSEELRRPVTYPLICDFWSSRWLWAANGSHSRALEHAHPELATRKEGQAYRKAVMEQWQHNPMDRWDGTVYVTPSAKLEHGKTRLLLACDTLSYMWFEYALRPVERIWENSNVILDPGSMGNCGIATRINGWRNGMPGQSFFAVDYDDFNSQHTLMSQKIVFEELFHHIGYNASWVKTLVDSFDSMELWIKGKCAGIMAGTLMSGHRATSFINSVLNRAYIICAGGHVPTSMHVGDDILMSCTLGHADNLIANLNRKGVRLNASKQVFSKTSGEFLRVAHREHTSHGYLARVISSAVSGNWVSDHTLNQQEALMNAIVCCRGILNRSLPGEKNPVVRVISRSVSKRTKIEEKTIRLLLSGRACLKGGVVYGEQTNYIQVYRINCRVERSEEKLPPYRHATEDYLNNHLADIEVMAVRQYGSDIADIMAQASWKKSMSTEGAEDVSRLSLQRDKTLPCLHCITEKETSLLPVRYGLFSSYPILMMLKDRIPIKEALKLAVTIGYRPQPNSDLELDLWGESNNSCAIEGVLPYNEATSLAQKLPCGGVVIQVIHNVYV